MAGRRRLIVGLAWPALAESILASFISMVDMMMVSGLGAYAINAVGLVTQPRFVLLASFMALGVGATAMAARFKGARDKKNANAVLNQAITMTIILTAILCALMLIGGESLLRLLAGKNISERTIQEAMGYLRIQVYGFPTLSLTFCINAVLRGVGNTRTSFYSNTAANIVNVFFNYCMIGGNLGFPAMGVRGASLATVIGQFVGLCIVIYTVCRNGEYLKFDLRQLVRIDLSMIRRLLNIGLPALGEQLIMRVGMLIFTAIITSLGENAYASHMIAINIQQLSFTTGLAFGAAAATAVGQSLGRVRADLAMIYVRTTQNMCSLVSLIVAVFLFFGGEMVASLYSNDVDIIHQSAHILKIIAVSNPFSNARFVYMSALRGAGDSRFAAIITFVGVLLVRPIISWVLITHHLPFQIGLTGVWISLVSDGFICYAISKVRFMHGAWQTIEV
ncbi:MAG: MATE family efflux transporter [Synergistaceae bacterium]|nr:MATE family efflux transporter [Synergistaceae bacterium]